MLVALLPLSVSKGMHVNGWIKEAPCDWSKCPMPGRDSVEASGRETRGQCGCTACDSAKNIVRLHLEATSRSLRDHLGPTWSREPVDW